MARFNEVQVARYNRFLQKLLAMKGQAVTPILSTEMQGVINFFNGAENRYLESWFRFGVFTSVAANAGQLSAFLLDNPGGSNVMAVVEKIAIANANASATDFKLEHGPKTGNYATIVSNIARFDPPGQQVPTLITGPVNGVLTPSIWWRERFLEDSERS